MFEDQALVVFRVAVAVLALITLWRLTSLIRIGNDLGPRVNDLILVVFGFLFLVILAQVESIVTNAPWSYRNILTPVVVWIAFRGTKRWHQQLR